VLLLLANGKILVSHSFARGDCLSVIKKMRIFYWLVLKAKKELGTATGEYLIDINELGTATGIFFIQFEFSTETWKFLIEFEFCTTAG
jgi:uncharacterized membrane-anchored protein